MSPRNLITELEKKNFFLNWKRMVCQNLVQRIMLILGNIIC